MLQPESALPDTETETDEMLQNAGEKGEPHKDPKDPPRRRGNKRKGHGIYENDRPLLSARWGVKVVWCDYALNTEPMVRHSPHMCTSLRSPLLPSIQMDGAVIMVLTAPVLLSAIVMVNGREMAMRMVFAKSTSIRLKASGQRCATFCAHFAVFIKSSFRDILLSVNLLLISNLLRLILYQNLFNALNLNMSLGNILDIYCPTNHKNF